MSSAGGGSGIGGRTPVGRDYGQPAVGDDVKQPGTPSVGTPGSGGVEGQAEVLSPEQLVALTKARIEADADKSGIENKRPSISGPQDASAGKTELDGALEAKVFGGAVYNANTTPQTFARIKGTPQFTDSVGKLTTYLANPTQQNQQAVLTSLNGLASSAAGLNASGTKSTSSGINITTVPPGTLNPNGKAGGEANIMEVLYLVFRESIKDTNEDKKYYLTKLQEYNKMGEELSAYLHDLAEASRELGARAAGAKYPEMELTGSAVEIKQFDLSTLGKDGKLHTTSVESKRLDRTGLNETIKEVESMQETVRNKRQMASTAFQNFDQKANQLYNLLSSVMKAFNEMRSGVVRNML